MSYPDIASVGGRCQGCWCCSKCSKKCQESEGGCVAETQDDITFRVLGIDPSTAEMKKARAFKKYLEREEGEYYSDIDVSTGESDTDNECS